MLNFALDQCVCLKKVTFATNSSLKVTAEPLDGVDFRQLVPRMSDRNPSLTLQIKSLWGYKTCHVFWFVYLCDCVCVCVCVCVCFNPRSCVVSAGASGDKPGMPVRGFCLCVYARAIIMRTIHQHQIPLTNIRGGGRRRGMARVKVWGGGWRVRWEGGS